jgi:hypothetical protein
LDKLERSRLYSPSAIEPRESAQEGREVGFMILAMEPCPMPSLKGSFQGKIEEASRRAGLETYAPNSLPVGGTRLVLQEEVIFERGKLGGILRKTSQRWMKIAI